MNGAPEPPRPIDALDPGEPSPSCYSGFYDRTTIVTSRLQLGTIMSILDEDINDLPENMIRLCVSAPPTEPTDPKLHPVHFPIALLYQLSIMIKQTYSRACLCIDLVYAVNHDANVTNIPRIATNSSLFLTNDDERAMVITQKYFPALLHNKKTDLLSGFVCILSDVPFWELRELPTPNNQLLSIVGSETTASVCTNLY